MKHLTFAALLLNLILLVYGDFTLQFQFHHYSNPSHHDANGDCCDCCYNPFTGNCPSCETLFSLLCFRNGGTSHSQTGQCIFGTSHTPGSVGGDSIEFGSSIGSLSNPFTFTRTGSIPQAGYQLYLVIYDDDTLSNDDLIDRVIVNVPGNLSSVQSQTVTGVFNRVSLVLSYTLSCSQHYYGTDCSVYCIPYNDIQNGHYTCNSTTGAKICREGWQNPANNCRDVACHLVCQSPGGQCSANGTCQCNTGWSGVECDTPQCTKGCHLQGGYCQLPNECTCRDNWNGTLCNISLCTTNCSSVGGHCTVPEVCTCLPGYTGEACDIDLLPCDHQMPCHNGASCSHTSNPGEYSCSCQTGYTGMTCETDIDECSMEPCHNNGTCINGEPGSFECICVIGWTGDLCDDPIDYCQSNPCMNNGSCTNLMTGHYCHCSTQFEGLNCELLVNACVPNPCQNNGTCTNMITNYTCTCTEGYSGINCENRTTFVADKPSSVTVSTTSTDLITQQPTNVPSTSNVPSTTSSASMGQPTPVLAAQSSSVVAPVIGTFIGLLVIAIVIIVLIIAVVFLVKRNKLATDNNELNDNSLKGGINSDFGTMDAFTNQTYGAPPLKLDSDVPSKDLYEEPPSPPVHNIYDTIETQSDYYTPGHVSGGLSLTSPLKTVPNPLYGDTAEESMYETPVDSSGTVEQSSDQGQMKGGSVVPNPVYNRLEREQQALYRSVPNPLYGDEQVSSQHYDYIEERSSVPAVASNTCTYEYIKTK